MRQIIEKKIVDTTDMTEVAKRVVVYTPSGSPVGWGIIYLADDGVYWYCIIGKDNIFAPDDSLTKIGKGLDALLSWVSENNKWNKEVDLIEHILNSKTSDIA